LIFRDAGELRAIMEIARLTPDAGPEGFLGDSPLWANGAAHRSDLMPGGSTPSVPKAEAKGSDEVVAVVVPGGGHAQDALQASPASTPEGATAASEDSEEVMEIDKSRQEASDGIDGMALDPPSRAGADPKVESKIEASAMRDIELEVSELRASLQLQGLHRDAIDDICDEKRQRLLEEHKATLAGPMREDSGERREEPTEEKEDEESSEESSHEQAARQEKEKAEKGKEKAKERAKEKEKEREKKKRDEEKAKEDRKTVAKKASKDGGKDKDQDKGHKRVKRRRSKSRGADASATKAKAKDASPKHDARGGKSKGKEKEKSRSRDRAKKSRK